MNQYDRVVDGVIEAKDLHSSLTRLLRNIASQFGGGTQAETQALAGMLELRAGHIVDAVLANTPMVTGTFPAPKHESEPSHEREEEVHDKKAKAAHHR